MKVWKLLGVAGVAGVAATGVVIARSERRRRAYAPDDVRARLHERYQEVVQADGATPGQPPPAPEEGAPLQSKRGCARFPRRSRRRR